VADTLQKSLERWTSAGVVDAATAQRIRAFEDSRRSGERLRWPVVLAVALGGMLLCLGILLFVAAHWDEMTPGLRFALVLLMVAAFPVVGALLSEKFPTLSITFHAIGTICLGAGIFLSAQIFNLEENWTNGVLLWAAGALIGWLLLKQWPHAAMLAVLMPSWLIGIWITNRGIDVDRAGNVVWQGLLLLSLTYLSAATTDHASSERRALVGLGGLALLPCGILAVVMRAELGRNYYGTPAISRTATLTAWLVAIGAPLCLAVLLRGRSAWMNGISALWVLSLELVTPRRTYAWADWDVIGFYIWAAVGACGVIAWGIAERRRERINLGVAGFALTVMLFYFSNIMDKLGRAESLAGAGILLILGGWGLERMRRALIARVQEA
jgi:uncharacterized membrane protein